MNRCRARISGQRDVPSSNVFINHGSGKINQLFWVGTQPVHIDGGVQGHAQLLAFGRRGRGQFSVLMGGLFRAQMESGSCVVHALEAEKKTNKKKQSSFRRNVQKALGSHSSFAVRPPVLERVWAPTEPKRDYGGEFSASTRLRERYVIYQAPESSILLENEIVVRNS